MKAFRQFLVRLRRRFLQTARLASWFRPRVALWRLRLLGKGRQAVFTYIYEKRRWDSRESVSGGGSTLEATAALREQLPEVLAGLGVRSLLDAPCGDFNWMEATALDIDSYIGAEIVPALVKALNDRFASPVRLFVHLDITSDPLPEAAAFFCRDCLLHLSNAEVALVLKNAVRSSCTYLLASTYPGCARNLDIRTGLSRPVNLCRPPFDLPEPICTIADPGGIYDEKCLGVWDLRQIRRQYELAASLLTTALRG